MTYFINLRGTAWGAVCPAYVIEADGTTDRARAVGWGEIASLVRDKNILALTHGFNVSYVEGLRCLARFESEISIGSNELFLGVLWPGDWIIPAVNYPFEDSVAMKAGEMLAQFVDRSLTGARSISVGSHSLGARVMLRTIARSQRRFRRACLAAAAVNDDCLSTEFAAADANCDDLRTLSSSEDAVLGLAFPPGDLIADILLPDHRPFRRALGLRGPSDPWPPNVRPAQIPDQYGYGHGDYLPPSGAQWNSADPDARWRHASAFIAAAMRGGSTPWP